MNFKIVLPLALSLACIQVSAEEPTENSKSRKPASVIRTESGVTLTDNCGNIERPGSMSTACIFTLQIDSTKTCYYVGSAAPVCVVKEKGKDTLVLSGSVSVSK